MRLIFVDSAAWIALMNVRDDLHPQAQAVIDAFDDSTRLITTEFVLLEVADALSAPLLRTHTVDYINNLRQLSILEIVPASSTLFAAGWTLYSQRPDKEWGLTDCTSFAAMSQRQITEAFTSDHHFEQAGFVKLL